MWEGFNNKLLVSNGASNALPRLLISSFTFTLHSSFQVPCSFENVYSRMCYHTASVDHDLYESARSSKIDAFRDASLAMFDSSPLDGSSILLDIADLWSPSFPCMRSFGWCLMDSRVSLHDAEAPLTVALLADFIRL